MGAIVVVVLLLLLAGTALTTFGGNALRGTAERVALEKTGRVLTIDGDIGLDFGWPAQLRLHAERVAFANADWAQGPPQMLTAERLEAAVNLLQLLAGRTVVDELRLRNADVALERDAEGRKNWELRKTEEQPLSLGRVVLDDTRIAYDEPARNTALQGRISTAPNGMAFTVEGKYLGQPLAARGGGGALPDLRDTGRPYPLDVQARLGKTEVRAKGSVTGLAKLDAVDIQGSISGETLEQLYPVLGVALPDTPAYRSSGRVVHQGSVWRYENFRARIGESDAAGTLQVDTGGPHPVVRGEIRFGMLDLADLGVAIGTHKERRRLLPDTPFNTRRWRSIDADLRLAADKVARPEGLALEHFAAHVTLDRALLKIEPLEFGLAGGKLAGSVTLDGRRDPIRATVNIKADKVAVDRIVPGFDPGKADPGRVDGRIELAGQGDSVAQMLGNADGAIALLVNGGHVSRLLMEEVGLHIPRIVALKAAGDQRVAIRCAVADFKVTDGVMQTRTGVFDTSVMRVDARGTISLRDEALDLTLVPDTKETAVGSLRTPIHVRGTFSKPDIALEKGPLAAKTLGAAALAAINPLLALAPLIEAGPGHDSDCGRLLSQSPAAGKGQDGKPAGKKRP